MRLRLCTVLGLMAVALVAFPEAPTRVGLALPEVILDGSRFRARLYPHFADFDGDGVTDLLVGVGDRLSVYRNVGTDRRPVYAAPTWFDEGEPSSHLPSG